MKRIILIVIIIAIVVAIASYASSFFVVDNSNSINSEQNGQNNGGQNTQTGTSTTNGNGRGNKSDLIVVSSPIRGAEISSPLTIAGRARGTWYFEGSFPVKLVDQYGNVIATSYVTAQGEWMTTEFVPFLGTLQFNNYISGQPGKLILQKDNPSGLPEHDDSIEIPIVFK